MRRKKAKHLIDSRHLKILSVKKDDLKDALVIIVLDENKFGRADKMNLRQIAEQIQKIEPEGIYFPVTKNMNVHIYDRASFKNRDIVVSIKSDSNVSEAQIEDEVSKAFADARSIKFVHGDMSVDRGQP